MTSYLDVASNEAQGSTRIAGEVSEDDDYKHECTDRKIKHTKVLQILGVLKEHQHQRRSSTIHCQNL